MIADGENPDQPDPRRYVRLAAMLRQRIHDGTLPPGSPVPSITALTEELGWGRQTGGRALQLLEREGLVFRVPGLGYHVASPDTPGGQQTSG
jgi:GntR family transcriptional regulator